MFQLSAIQMLSNKESTFNDLDVMKESTFNDLDVMKESTFNDLDVIKESKILEYNNLFDPDPGRATMILRTVICSSPLLT
jgi:hypothetical protein